MSLSNLNLTNISGTKLRLPSMEYITHQVSLNLSPRSSECYKANQACSCSFCAGCVLLNNFTDIKQCNCPDCLGLLVLDNSIANTATILFQRQKYPFAQ